MSLLWSGARAPLQSRNNSDIMCITEIIVLLYPLYELYHYYFNCFVLYQSIFLWKDFLKEKSLQLYHLYILSHIMQVISIMTLIHIIRFIHIKRIITFVFSVMPWGAGWRMEMPAPKIGRTPMAFHWRLIAFGTAQWLRWLQPTTQALVWVLDWIYGSEPRWAFISALNVLYQLYQLYAL